MAGRGNLVKMIETATCFYCHHSNLAIHSYGRVYCQKCKMRYSLGKIARLEKIVEYFSLEVPAFKSSQILKLHYKTVYRIYNKLREEIAKAMFLGLIDKLPQLKDEGILININSSCGAKLGLAVVNINRLLYPFFFDPYAEGKMQKILNDRGLTFSIILNNEVLSLKTLLKKGVNDSFNFWSNAKRRLRKFNGVTKKHLACYLFEIAFRLNNRKNNLQELLLSLIKER